jgi:chemotaxis protein methyltransferase CheR
MSSNEPSAEIVDRVARLLQSRIGLRPDPFLRSRLGRSIRDEAAVRGQCIDDYLHTLFVTDGGLQGLLNRVTVQETGFFRHPEQFHVLARDILPTLSRPIRIWSAGCANGQEAFSLAMLLDEQQLDGSVIATDLSTAALHRTTMARYSRRELTGLSPIRIARHLTMTGGGWEINEAVRRRVTTSVHNLMSPLPDEVRSSQVIFCRNVLIYFSPEHTKAFLDRVADALPSGWLFLGSAETMWTVSERFETIRIGDAYTYRPTTASPAKPAGLPNSRRTRKPARRVSSVPMPSGGSVEGSPRTSGSTAGVSTSAKSLASHTTASPPGGDSDVTVLAQDGQLALSAGNPEEAIVQFRKWVYLAQDDAIAHLHLGIALEATGDRASAQRAFGAARRALQASDAVRVEPAIGGYATAELLRLLDSKRR